MMTQKGEQKMNRIPIKLTFLEYFGFLSLDSLSYTSSTLFKQQSREFIQNLENLMTKMTDDIPP